MVCLSPITPESGYMPRSVRESYHDLSNSCHTSCQSFREDNQIRADTVSVVCKILTSPPKAALHLISNEKDIVLLTQLLDFIQVTRGRYDDAASVSPASLIFTRTTHPAEPWIGSTMSAAILSPSASKASRTSSIFPKRISLPAGENGPTFGMNGPYTDGNHQTR